MNRRLSDRDLLLASASPRRRELLVRAGVRPVVRPVDVEERPLNGEAPESMVRRLARQKARTALDLTELGRLVLAADTAVVDRARILGKPEDRGRAVRMLMRLRGRSHEVLTALVMVERESGQELARVVRSRLRMRSYSRSEVEAYVAGGSPMDKAGAYGIQDEDLQPVKMDDFQDCFTNVMGLSLCALGGMLGELGWRTGTDLVEACWAYRPHSLTNPRGEL